MQNKRPDRPSSKAARLHLDDFLWDIIVNCWQRDEYLRPTMGEVDRSLRVLQQLKHCQNLEEYFSRSSPTGEVLPLTFNPSTSVLSNVSVVPRPMNVTLTPLLQLSNVQHQTRSLKISMANYANTLVPDSEAKISFVTSFAADSACSIDVWKGYYKSRAISFKRIRRGCKRRCQTSTGIPDVGSS